MKRFLLILATGVFLLAVLSGPAVGMVDMKNANYSDSWTDVEVELTPDALFDIERTYNSRSLHDGMFGFGWCSELETTFTMGGEGEIVVTVCGSGLRETFYPASAGEGGSKRYYNRSKSGFIDVKPDGYEWTTSVGLRQKNRGMGCPPSYRAVRRYDNLWRTVAVTIRGIGGYHVTYHGGKREVDQVTFDTGEVLSFQYYSNGKVAKIESNKNGKGSEYRYSRDGDLIRVKNWWGNTYSYMYDGWHNLTRIDLPDHTYKALTYDVERDWVMSFRNRDGCLEEYQYSNGVFAGGARNKAVSRENDGETSRGPEGLESPTQAPPPQYLDYSAVFTKTCDGKVVTSGIYSFRHATDKGGRYLERVATRINQVNNEIRYHRKSGKPIEVTRSDVRELYDRGEHGELLGQKIFCEDGRTLNFTRMNTAAPAR